MRYPERAMHFSFGEAAGLERLSARRLRLIEGSLTNCSNRVSFRTPIQKFQFCSATWIFNPAAVRNAFASGGVATPNVWKLLFGEAIQRVLSCRIMPESS